MQGNDEQRGRGSWGAKIAKHSTEVAIGATLIQKYGGFVAITSQKQSSIEWRPFLELRSITLVLLFEREICGIVTIGNSRTGRKAVFAEWEWDFVTVVQQDDANDGTSPR
ncbi:hypothetical protein B0H13DRAFT_1879950 [Mycena leptocephala]|nr:hypothetical protein B0H13DRAFT_1879950 [Mycena leptocephala]